MQMEELSAIDLIEECRRSKSTPVWEEFVRRFQPVIATALWRALNRFHGDSRRDVLDDLVQQTFLRLCHDNCRVLRNLDLRSDGGVIVYLRTIATNIAIDYLRSSKPPADPVNENLADLSPHRGDHALLLADVDRHLRACSQSNYERDRRVFWFYYRSGLSAKAIASIPTVDLTESGVESLILRLRQCIRQIFNQKPSGKGFSPPGSLLTGERKFGAA